MMPGLGGMNVGALLVAGGVAFAAGVGVGWKFIGYPQGYRDGVKSERAEKNDKYDVLYQTSLRITKEREQCYAKVDEVNAEIDRQRAENKRIEDTDRIARSIAVERAEKSAERAAEQTVKIRQDMEAGRAAIAKIEDACLHGGAPAEYVRVLNTIFARTPAANAGVNALPGAKAGN